MQDRASARGRYKFDFMTLAWHVKERWPDFERPRVGELDAVMEHLQIRGQLKLRQIVNGGVVAILCEANHEHQTG